VNPPSTLPLSCLSNVIPPPPPPQKPNFLNRAIQAAVNNGHLAVVRVLAKAGATIEGNTLLKALEVRSYDGEIVRVVKRLINHGPPMDLNSLEDGSNRQTAMEAINGLLHEKGSDRLVKFLIKKGARVSWLELCKIGCMNGGNENAMIELLRGCVAEDKRSTETLREDSVKERVQALSSVLLYATRQKYWKLLKMTLKQEGVDLNYDSPISYLQKGDIHVPLVSTISQYSWYIPTPPLQQPINEHQSK